MIKICLIGGGRAGMIHARNYQFRIPGAKVTAVVDPDEKNARESAEELGVPLFSEFREALDKVEFSAVCIGAPTFVHVNAVVEAAEAGKDIFCEKPLSISLNEAERMQKAVEDNGVKFQIGFMRRFDASFVRAKKMIEEGKIGDPILVKSVGRSPGSGRLSAWIADVEKSNGVLAEVNTHDFDVIRWLVDSDFREVFSYADNLKCPSYEEEYPEFYDTAAVNIKFENGILGMVDGCYPATYGYDARTEVLGTEGMLQVGSKESHSVLIWNKSGDIVSEGNRGWQSLFAEAYLEEDRYFVKCLQEDRAPRPNIVDGKKAVEIVLAANESIKTGEPVKL
ncbi:MAG: Gfo/Idh/MocA family oxidoreductase [Halanaerobiaceae bacterium]